MVERSYTARNRRFRAVHKARRAVRHSLGGIADSFSFSLPHFLFLLPAGPSGRKAGRHLPTYGPPGWAAGALRAARPIRGPKAGMPARRKNTPYGGISAFHRPFGPKKIPPMGVFLDFLRKKIPPMADFLRIQGPKCDIFITKCPKLREF